MAKTLTIQGAPGTIKTCEFSAQNIKAKDEVGALPQRVKTLGLLLDLSDESYMDQLLVLFPGIDFMIKAAAGSDVGAAFNVTSSRKFPPMTVKVVTADGTVIAEAVNAKPKGRPVARVSAKADRIEVPLKLTMALPKSALQKVDDAIGADCLIDLVVSQTDVDDHIKDGADDGDDGATEKAAAKKKGSNKKTTVQLGLVENKN